VMFGRMAGYRIRMIRIGQGPVLFRLHIGFALLVWRLIPVSGAVAVYQPLTEVRRARLTLIAGGAAANVLVACLLAATLSWQPDLVAHPTLTLMLLVQGYGVLNLLIVIGPGRRGATDGGNFRATLRRPPAVENHALMHLYTSRVTEPHSRGKAPLPSALAPVVLHALTIGTPEASYEQLTAADTVATRRERVRLQDRLLTRGELTTAERDALLAARAVDTGASEA